MNEIPGKTNREKSPYQLKMRLLKACGNSGIQRRSLRQLEPTFLPQPKVDLANLTAEEMFILLIEGVQRYKIVRIKAEAEKTLAKTLSIADYLVDNLPGNAAASKFTYDAMILIQSQNTKLGEDVKQIMEAAHKRGAVRERKREELYRKWRANQSKF